MPINRKILVLDDEPGILDTYRAIFTPVAPKAIRSSRGAAAATSAMAPVAQTEIFQVSYAQNGLEALKLIEDALKQNEPFVGGFFDVKLGPGIDGIETIRRAKEMDPNLLCVIATAYQDRSVDEIAQIFGEEYSDRWDFLNKPFSMGEITQKARNLVSNWDRRKREREHLQTIENQQEQLIRSERLAAAGTLARGVGHEFGNILLRIVGKAELLMQQDQTEDTKKSLKIIVEAALRAGVIVRNLNSLAKVESKFEKGSLLQPIQDSLNLIAHELKDAGIDIKENHAPTLPPISLNKVELGQVFLNLFINAKHAMEKNGGTLTITTALEQNSIVVSVSDTGCGIPKENLEKIFEALFTTKGEKGSGIGLSVTKSIIEKHKGKISVMSAVGQGTTFRLFFPI